MVIGDLLKEATEKLTTAGVDTARLDSEVLLSFLLQKERLYLLMNRNQEMAAETENEFWKLIERRVKKEPVAYIVGQREFMSLNFSVCPGVLIPRPDTETLVEYAIEQLQNVKNPDILDLCTGSGAISVSLAHYLPESRVTAVDISDVCVKIAEKNAAENGVANRVAVVCEDVFAYQCETQFDCVVSNPPYIPTAVVSTLEEDVRKFEPHLALDGGTDGYDFYRYLATKGAELLKSGGLFLLEVGHDQAEAVKYLLEETKAYKSVGTVCDLAGISRVVYAQKR